MESLKTLTDIFRRTLSSRDHKSVDVAEQERLEYVVPRLATQDRYDFYLQAIAGPIFGITCYECDLDAYEATRSNDVETKLSNIEGYMDYLKSHQIMPALDEELQSEIDEKYPEGMEERLPLLEKRISTLLEELQEQEKSLGSVVFLPFFNRGPGPGP